ncbi:hypothetical protein PVAND_013074 [Polypedilum vanderplanki]|uniref:Cystatin domain-containing protein n=1 Tax=Polypedilum vanderplanki TaxID=319348 RepID=A0A9J6CND7_POLVA|nr:hypothetical protein PVAND_013074 [Polypedilum vanderplanki]
MKIFSVFIFMTFSYAQLNELESIGKSPKFNLICRENIVTNKETIKQVQNNLEENLSSINGSWKMKEITKVTQQIVSGIKYKLTGIFTETNERKNYELEITIWSQPWMNKNEVKLVKKTALK